MTTHPDEKAGRKQADQILAYIERHGSITPLDALLEIGCMRLAARIGDLKGAGHPIRMRRIEVRARSGKTARVAEYYLDRPARAPIATDQQQGLAL